MKEKDHTALYLSLKDSISFEDEGFHSIAFLAATLVERQLSSPSGNCNLGIQFTPTIPFIMPGFTFTLIGHVRDIKIKNDLLFLMLQDFYGSVSIQVTHEGFEICKKLFGSETKGHFDCRVEYDFDGANTAKIVASEVKSLADIVKPIELGRHAAQLKNTNIDTKIIADKMTSEPTLNNDPNFRRVEIEPDNFELKDYIPLSCSKDASQIVHKFFFGRNLLAPALLLVGGECGDGKTHLIYGHCTELLRQDPKLKIYMNHGFVPLPKQSFLPEAGSILYFEGAQWTLKEYAENAAPLIKNFLDNGVSIVIEVDDSDDFLRRTQLTDDRIFHAKITRPTLLDKLKIAHYYYLQYFNSCPDLLAKIICLYVAAKSKTLRAVQVRIKKEQMRRNLIISSKK